MGTELKQHLQSFVRVVLLQRDTLRHKDHSHTLLSIQTQSPHDQYILCL